MKQTARELAFKILYDIFSNKAFSNISIKKHLKIEIDPKEENLVREIVFGVLENDLYLNYIISKASKTPMNKIHLKIMIILKIGIYQLLFMDRIPSSAAVNESVKLAKIHGHKGTIGFVNGILRNIGRNKDRFLKIEVNEKSDLISIKYSHPKWLVDRWIKEFGEDFTEELCKENNTYSNLNIRINTLKISKFELKNRLEKYGFIIKEGKYCDDILIIENPIRLTETEEYKLGYFIIQDESSALVGQIMNPKEGSTVLDLCSAPGGKSTHIGQIMKNKGKVLSMDFYEHKIKLIEENAKRLGIDIIQAFTGDATRYNESLKNIADYVLVDAPCSGFGLIRRKPEIKWNRKEGDIEELVEIQRSILNNAKEYLKVGGFLVYSTCTIEKEENINMINGFLKENENFRLVNIQNLVKGLENEVSLKQGFIQLYPHIHKVDGFFIAKMIKER
ncbi:MAG: 16S rRNA (cytosine(967)-C(5))-methyltransferase RsmB [Tissierellia bacterium]|nr:16S rRNA (cytosine(967)-C(5))-methyltransferase RsmB [Tissierellia bacterium]